MQRVKMGKKKGEQADSKWRHSTEAVLKGKVTYNCKFLGSAPVSKSKGSELIKESIKKLQFANDIKKSEEGLKASKLKKVELCISVQTLILTDIKTRTTLYSFPLTRISYCADDKTTKRLFGFIARERESPQHYCYILECDRNAEEVTLAVGQAFELAYKKFKANQAVAGNKEAVHMMQKRVESKEKENEMLKKKLEELERTSQQGVSSVPSFPSAFPSAVSESCSVGNNDFNPAATDSGKQANFNPFSDSGTFASDSSSSHANPETFPVGNGADAFAVMSQETSTSNQDDWLQMFTTAETPSVPVSGDHDIFDPLAQINGASPSQENNTQQTPNFSPFDQAPVSQNEVPAGPAGFDVPATPAASAMPAPVSRPKSAASSGGLLPPPPTKQSIKEKNRISNPPAGQTIATVDLTSDSSISPNHNQGVKDVEEGVENNLVIF